MQSQPLKYLPLFTVTNKSGISADKLIALFEGSNDRESEEAVIFNWENYIRETAGKAFTVDLDFPTLSLFTSQVPAERESLLV